MVILREVDQQNFEECCGLERQSSKFVGNTESVLAEAYIFRAHSTAYAIYNDDIVIGLVIILDRPRSCDKYYSFTDLFIADNFLGNGYGKQAVQAILDKFRSEKKRDTVEIQVHQSNDIANGIYTNYGFNKIKAADWDEHFDVMQLEL